MSKLDNKTVQIVITLPQSGEPLNLRPFILSLGVDGQLPIFDEGLFPEIEEKLRQLWWQFVPQIEEADSSKDAVTAESEVDKPKVTSQSPDVAEPTLSLF